MPKRTLQALDGKGVIYTNWEPYDEENMVVRFCTSWATTKEQIETLAEIIDAING